MTVDAKLIGFQQSLRKVYLSFETAILTPESYKHCGNTLFLGNARRGCSVSSGVDENQRQTAWRRNEPHSRVCPARQPGHRSFDFLSVSELQAVGMNFSSADCLLLQIVDTRHGPAVSVSGRPGSDSQEAIGSLGD